MKPSFCTENKDVCCFLVTKLSWKGKYRRIFSIGTLAITTYNPQTLEITNQWLYEDFIAIKCVSDRIRHSNADSHFRSEDVFTIQVRKKGKFETMKFCSDYSREVVTEALNFQSNFGSDALLKRLKYDCFKQSWRDERVPICFELSAGSLNQVDQYSKKILKRYWYKDIKQISLSNHPGGFVIEVGEQRRRHFFVSNARETFIQNMQKLAVEYIAVDIAIDKEMLSVDDFFKTRLGLCSKDELLTPYADFAVQKFTIYSNTPVRRLICLSETCIMERDPVSYSVICARFLKNIVCLVRDLADPQKFFIQYKNNDERSYLSNERDSILASLIDGTRASGNHQVFVTSQNFKRSQRILPFDQLLEEDGEVQLIKHIINVPPGLRRCDMICRFNANVLYNGLSYSNLSEGFLPDSKGRLIVSSLEAVLAETYADVANNSNNVANSPFVKVKPKSDKNLVDVIWKIEAQLACLHRLFASKIGFQAFTSVHGIRERLGPLVVAVLKKQNEAIDHSTVEMLCALMQPMHFNYELRFEQLNKQSLLASRQFVEHLLQLVVNHVNQGTGALVIASMLDFLTYAICAPYSETSPGEIFDMILELVADRGRSFYRLFHSPSMTIVKGAGLVLKAIIEESPKEISKKMQNLSLTEGAFLKHLELALFSTGNDFRVLANRQLSGQLISLWIAENSAAMELLRRCIPRGLLDYLQSSDKPPVTEKDLIITRNNLEEASNKQQRSQFEENLKSMQVVMEAKLETLLQHWNLERKLSFLQPRDDKNQKNIVVLRKRRRQIKATANWKMFQYQFGLECAKANLIWNEKTKSELHQSVEKEMIQLKHELDCVVEGTFLSWNYSEFEVIYPSLQEEIRIGDYYLRFLLNENNEEATPIHNPSEFFNDVYHRFLLATRSDYKCMCLKAMGVVYERHCITIGAFSDSKEIVEMLSYCTNVAERDYYLFLINKLVLDKTNVRDLITAGVVPLIVDLVSLAHLHVNRAKIHSQTNVIESSVNERESQSKEWYFKDKSEQRQGPYSFKKMKQLYEEGKICDKTSIWAEGLEDWCLLSKIPQYRWTVIYNQSNNCIQTNGSTTSENDISLGSMYNLTELCCLIIDTLIQMCAFFPSRDENDSIIRPMPRIKKILSQPIFLYPIVQLLLTYDPSIVYRVAQLLSSVMQDNPGMSGLYLSGVFFFILMYNGSNILPIARFLHQTHLQQAFRSTLTKSEMASRSVLCPMLPEATIYYLNQYGPEKYAEVFLGEFENPEIIWNSEMRRYMIEKIALHIADFSIRLSSNVKALYGYCPIPPIEYPQLKDELFCHFYYLRHLTDEIKFSNWPIREPVEFLRSCLAMWHDEINKKPATMSVEQACERLGLNTTDNSWKNQATVRRAYFKLAPKYHPDRNPEGREHFEQINSAYEFLTSTLIRNKNSVIPDLQRIVVCLRAQSIVYSRHLKVLSIYKYAGYTQLIKTIELKSGDDLLFSANVNAGVLLVAAVELCYWTLRSAPLNAEQLRREAGLDVLYKTFERCSPMIGTSSKETDMPVQVCFHVCKCFATAAKYEACREKICDMKLFFSSLCRLLKFEHLTRLACTASECVCAFSVSTLLQTQLFQAGVIWQLVPHLFRFDYTLNEGGVVHSETSNQQAVFNRLARNACEALSCLAGYRPECPDNDGVQNSLCALLTPFICRVMVDDWPSVEGTPQTYDNNGKLNDDAVGSCDGNETDLDKRLRCYQQRNDQILKVLNSNTKNPYIIWDNATRSELLDFVEIYRTSTNNASDLFGAEFRMSVYAKELVVGEIFVQVYNNQPEFKLYEPKKVCIDLLEYLKKNLNELLGQTKPNVSAKPALLAQTAAAKLANSDLIDFSELMPNVNWNIAKSAKLSGNQMNLKEKVLMVLEALYNVLLRNSGVEILLIGHFGLIFNFLRGYNFPDVQEKTLKVIWISSRNRECINDISCSIQLPLLLVLLVKLSNSTEIILKILIALVSNGLAVKEMLEYGGLIYILNILVTANSSSHLQASIRLLAAQLLAKLQSDKLTGPKWSRYMTAYLPSIFADCLREDVHQVIAMFDSNVENPELIWNDITRQTVKESLLSIQNELVTAQSVDPTNKWNVSINNVSCAYSSVVKDELIVGTVYLRLFISNPSWNVRHPRQFATELMEKVLEIMRQPDALNETKNKALETITKAMVLLFAHHPSTADQIPAQGYLPQFCQAMQSANEQGGRSALLILSQLSENLNCSKCFGTLPVIKGLFACMKHQSQLIGEAAHSLKFLLSHCTSELAEQMYVTGIIPHLLKIVADQLPGIKSSPAVKAEIVDALKSCCKDLEFGARILSLLQKSSVWAQYKDQNHDLFLPATSQQYAITGGSSAISVAGFLTNTMFEPPLSQRTAPPSILPKNTSTGPALSATQPY